MEAPQEDPITPPVTPIQERFDDSAIGTPASSAPSDLTIHSITRRRIQDGKECWFPPTLPYNEDRGVSWDIFHDICMRVLKYPIFAPVVGPHGVLEVGTNTGIWAVEAADEYPGATVIAVDKTTRQTTWIPPNLSFLYLDWDDEGEWGMNERFDVANVSTLDVHDWPRLFGNCYQSLRPGGWLQCSGIHLHPRSDHFEIPQVSHLVHLCNRVREAWRASGVDLDALFKWEQLLRGAGFEHVQVQKFKIPCHTWPKDPKLKGIGMRFATWLADELRTSALTLFERIDMSIASTNFLLAAAETEIKDRKRCQYFDMYTVIGKRPEPDIVE